MGASTEKLIQIFSFPWCFKVQPRHVTEAYNLLNKSIIRVEQPDIYLEDEDMEDEPAQVAQSTQDQGSEIQDQGSQVQGQGSQVQDQG